MANFCKWKDLETEALNYNAMIEEGLMDADLFEGFFTPEQRQQIISKAYNSESNTWNYLTEDMFQMEDTTEESPEPTGDPSMDLTRAAEYNSYTATAHKMRVSRNLRSLYAINQLTEEFRDAVYSRCVFDYNNPTAKPSTADISRILNAYKYELAEWLNDNLHLEISLKNDTDEELNTSIHEVMNAAAEHLDDITLSAITQLEVKKTFYKLAYFENLLNDLELVTRKKSIAEYDNSWDMYDPKFGKDKVFAHTFSQDDGDLDMDQITTPFIKEFFNYMPLVNTNGEPDKKLKVGWNGFQRAMTAFMSWVKVYGDPELYEKITNGDFAAVEEGLDAWLKSKQIVGSIYNSGVNEDIARSLQKYVFGDPYATVPENIKNIIYTQIVKTAKKAYLSYDYEAKTKSITLDVIEDKAIISESSHLTNIIIGRVKQIRKDKSLYDSLFGENGKIRDLDISKTASNALRITFNYTSSNGETKTFSFIANKNTDDNGNVKNWDFNISTDNNVDEDHDDIVFDLIYDLFGYNLGLPENADDKQVIHNFLRESLGAEKTILDIFKDPICLTLLSGEKTKAEKQGLKFKYYDDAETTIDLRNYFKNYDDLAKFLYWCTGYDSKNVVRDIKGDKIPVYGLVSAIMQYPTLLYKAREATSNSNSVYHNIATAQPLLNGDLQIGDPLIRNGISTSTGQKSSSDMSESEILITSAFVDYGQSLLFNTNKKIDGYRGHRFMDGNTVFIQPTVFSDKSQQFVLPFTFANNSEILKSLKDLAKGNLKDKKTAEAYLTKYIFEWQSRKYRSLIEQVYNKYARVYPESQLNAFKLYNQDGSFNLEALSYLESHIAQKASNLELMRARFAQAGEDLVPEIDYSKTDGKYGLNRAIKYKALSVFASEQSTANYLEVQKRLLVQDIVNNNINLYDNILKVTGLPEEWTKNGQILLYKIYKVDPMGRRSAVPSTFDERIILKSNGEINPEYEVELNPVLNSWIYGDGICSQSWEEIFFGLNENNPNKTEGGNEAEVAGRLLAHYKRTVPAGSTVHLYQQGRYDGVSKNFRIACVNDANFIYATNPMGETYGKDPHDGGALMNPYMAILARNSLGTAADGIHQAKTILHDVDEYGNGMLCKWATYTISHAMRRAGQGAKFNLEKLHRKMNLVPLNTTFLESIFDSKFQEIKQKYGNIYMWDISLNSNVVISNIKLVTDELGTYFNVTKQKCNEYGKPIDNVEYTARFGGSEVTLYDLDQAFGGAYFKLQNSNHKLEYSEQSDEFVTEILSSLAENGFDYREELISYLVNTSAIKRGQKNTNSAETLENDEKFRTTLISSKMGGLMMATEHDVDGHVREMSQIMASLVQKGYTAKQARKIYSDIAKIIEVTANDLFEGTALTEEKRKEVIENYLIKSLDNSSSKGIGASDAITLYAKEEIKDKDGNTKRLLIPFSLPDIRNKFLSVVNAYLTNEAIIRQYPGIQAVNTPSRGMIQYYTIDGHSYGFEAAAKKVYETITEEEVDNLCDFFDITETDPEFRKSKAVKYAFKPYSTRNKWDLLADIIQNLTGTRPASKIEVMQFVEDWKYLSLENLLDPEREFRTNYKKATNNDIIRFNEIRNATSDEIIDGVCDGQFAHQVLNQHSLRIGQTILVRYKGQIDPLTGKTIPGSNDETYKKVILESGYQRDIWANLVNPNNWDIYALDLAPEDLKQPRMNFTVSYGQHKETTDETDLDANRVMFYYRELTNPKAKPQYKIKKQALVDKVVAKILSFGDKYQFSRKLQNLIKAHEEANAKLPEDAERKPFNVYDKSINKDIILIFRDYQQEIYRQFKLHKKLTKNDEILGDQEAFSSNLDWEIKFNQIDAGEIAISAAYAKEFNLEEGDDLGEILEQGTSFFEHRIKQKADPSIFANKDDYDLILTDNLGNQTLVKINKGDWAPVGDDGNCLFVETSEEVEKQPVNTTYKGRKICSNEDWRQKNIKIGRIAKSSNSPSMRMIVLEDIKDLALFENSGLFNTRETVYNYTENNVNDLWDHFKETLKISKDKKFYLLPTGNDRNKQKISIDTTGRDILGKLQNFEKDKSDRYISRTAEKMYKHFEDTLLYFGTRIPSQALQSGMALKVKMFVGANSNQVFIPGAMHWFEGADYDIDKTYMMRLGLVNGTIDVLSDLYDDFGAKCSELPVPNSKNTYTTSVQNNVDPFITQNVNKNGGKWYYSGVNYINASSLIDGSNHNFNNDNMFEVIKSILENSEKDPTGSGNIVIIQDLPIAEGADSEAIMDTVLDYAEYLEDALKTHNQTKLTNKRRVSTGLMNKNVINAREILLDPETFLSASDPIAFGILQDFAKKSTLGGREKTVSIWNGMTKAIMQSQFQLGKKEIGIIATAIKTFLMKTSVVNDAVNRAADLMRQGNYDEALNILNKYVYEVVDLSGKQRLALLANINFQPLYDALTTNSVRLNKSVPTKFAGFINKETGNFDVKQMLDTLSEQDAEYDVLMALSSLLSAATDNAKELILSKINASQSTIDLFCTMLGTGYTLENILKVFSSNMFSLADTLTKTNLYSGSDSGRTLNSVINFILGKGSLLNGKYERRFNELFVLPEFLYDKNGKFIVQDKTKLRYHDTKSLGTLEEIYKTYIQPLKESDPKEQYKGDPDASIPFLKMSTKEKKQWFIEQLLAPQNFDSVQEKFESLFEVVQERLNKEAGKTSTNPEGDDADYGDFMPDYGYEDGGMEENPDNEGWGDDDQDLDRDPEDEGHMGKRKTKRSLNLTINDLTMEDINTFRDYLNTVKYKNKMISRIPPAERGGENQILNDIVEKILPVSEENRILGKIAKINQGLVSNDEDLYNLLSSLEIYFNNELRNVKEETLNKYHLNSNFNMLEFISDERIRQNWLNLFDEIKHESNVLRMLVESPNFFNMFKLYKISYDVSGMQYVTDLTRKVGAKVLQYIYDSDNGDVYHKLSSDQYRIIKKVVSDALPFIFLKTLPEEFRKFTYDKGTQVYPGQTANQLFSGGVTWDYDNPLTSTTSGEIDLGTTEGSATYKRWCETEILNTLKEKYGDNKFVRNLHVESRYNPKTKQWLTYLTLGIDMTNISNSVKLQAQFNEVQQDFLKIADDKIEFTGIEGDMPNMLSLKNIIYLYDLIQNKGGLGNNSFGPLFGETLRTDTLSNDTIISKYWNFLNSVDTLSDTSTRSTIEANSLSDLVKDVIWRMAGDVKTRQLINSYGEENRIAPVKNESGKIIGYTIDGQNIYFVSGDFRFDLPFTGQMIYNQAVTLDTKGTTHLFSQDVDENGNIVRLNNFATTRNVTRFILKQLLSKNPDINVIEEFSPDEFTEDEINAFRNWPIFSRNGKMYVNLGTIDAYTPARVLIPLMATVARNYKDKSGNYIYRQSWENLLDSLRRSVVYQDYVIRTFGKNNTPESDFYKEFAGQSMDDFVLATYIQDEIIKDHPFMTEETKVQSDESFIKNATNILDEIFGIKQTKIKVSDFSLKNIGEILNSFGALMNLTTSNPNQDFNTVAHENINTKRLIKSMIESGHLKINNC